MVFHSRLAITSATLTQRSISNDETYVCACKEWTQIQEGTIMYATQRGQSGQEWDETIV